PPIQVVVARDTVSAESPPHELASRLIGIDYSKLSSKPAVGPHKRDIAPAVRPEAEVAQVGGDLKDTSPARDRCLAHIRPRALDQGARSRFAGHRSAAERARDVLDDRPVLLARNATLAHPAIAGALRKRTQNSDVKRKVVGRNEVNRVADRPRLHQRALVLERSLHGPLREAVAAQPPR